MQQLCVIRGKLPFLSCMVSRVMLVKMSLQKSGYKTCVQPYSRAKKELTKKRIQNACAALQAPNKADKKRAHNFTTL